MTTTLPREDYFARVRPVLGRGLQGKVVRVEGLALGCRVVELLVSCMVEDLVVDPADPAGWPLGALGFGGGDRAAEVMRAYLAWKNPCLGVRFRATGEADLTIRARFTETWPCVTWDQGTRTVTMDLPRDDVPSFLEVSHSVALGVRDLLLGRAAWPRGVVFHGNGSWPFTQAPHPATPPAPAPAVPDGMHVMVVGCGSVGSEVVRQLKGVVSRWTLVDRGRVTVFNPHRQWFGLGEVGRRKVEALATRLSPARVRAVTRVAGGQDSAWFCRLVGEERPDVVLLSTGTSDHGALAEALWGLGVPHVVACAYPRARFFEVSVVDPARGTPCLHCFRGHLFKGVEPAPPMDDDVARFLYQPMEESARGAAWLDLVAEPATAVETSRVSDVAARCVRELLAPALSTWFQRLLDHATTCLLGGNVVEGAGDGENAYGLDYPGQVVRLGVGDLVGPEAVRTCPVCGRRLAVEHREEELPRGEPAEEDKGLLATLP
jgi:hypothetical protein